MFHARADVVRQVIQNASYTNAEGEQLAEEQALQQFVKHLRGKGIVYVIGNGGSAGIASHFHTDLVKALHIPASTLFDSNLLTCLANDLGYEHVFSHVLEKILQPRDALVAISSSGRSPNIVNAALVARAKGAAVVTLSGFSCDNPLRTKGHLNIWLDACDYGLVEVGHFAMLHALVDHEMRS